MHSARGIVSGVRRATKEVERIFAIKEMNDARALAWDIALLAGSLGDLVQMDIVSRMAAQNVPAVRGRRPAF